MPLNRKVTSSSCPARTEGHWKRFPSLVPAAGSRGQGHAARCPGQPAGSARCQPVAVLPSAVSAPQLRHRPAGLRALTDIPAQGKPLLCRELCAFPQIPPLCGEGTSTPLGFLRHGSQGEGHGVAAPPAAQRGRQSSGMWVVFVSPCARLC